MNKVIWIVMFNGLGNQCSPIIAFRTSEEAENWIYNRPDGRHSEIHHYSIEEIELENV